MAFASKTLAAVAFLALLPLGACATESAGRYVGPSPQGQDYQVAAPVAARLTPPESHDGLLSSPPNDARPGECYAKVVVPGQPIGAPPPQPRAVWVQTPPGPGQVTPTWCIYYLPGAQPQPVAMTPERFGWIRVICDKDATEEKIRHVQRRLHEWGDYDGAFDGHFDGSTAQGVIRFQEQRHINHGGYLSMKTVELLDGSPPPPPPASVNPYMQALAQANMTPAAPPPFAASIYQGPTYPQSVAQLGYAAPCPTTCVAPPVAYAPPPPSPPQVMIQRVIQPIYVPQQQTVYAPPPPPQVVVQRVVQPIYMTQQPVYAAPPQMACGQPACAMQAPSPCGANACNSQGGYWGGGYGQGGYAQPSGAAPYRTLLTWSGKSVY